MTEVSENTRVETLEDGSTHIMDVGSGIEFYVTHEPVLPRGNGPAKGQAIIPIEIRRGRGGGKDTIAEAPVPIISVPTKVARMTKTQYRNAVKQIEEMVAREGLIGNFLDQMKELNSGGFDFVLGKGTRAYQAAIRQALTDVNANDIATQRGWSPILRKFIDYWWKSGICCIVFNSEQRVVPEASGGLKKAFYPTTATFIDPLVLDLDELYTTGNVYWEVDDPTMKSMKVLKNKDPFVLMFPKSKTKQDGLNIWTQTEVAAMISKGTKRLPLPVRNTVLARRVDNDRDAYPAPYLMRCIDALNDKRLLRNADRSLLTKVINLILHVTVGSQIQGRAVHQDTLDEVQAAMRAQLEQDVSHFHVAVTSDAVNYKWVEVPAGAILRPEAYRVVNYELLAAMLGLVANQLLMDNGTIDMSLIVKTLYGKNAMAFDAFSTALIDVFYSQFIVLNKLDAKIGIGSLKVIPHRISIYETDAFKALISSGTVNGILTAKRFVDEVGDDWETTVEQHQEEKKLRDKYGILVGWPAFNQMVTTTNTNPTNPAPTNTVTTPPNGKPQGQPQNDTNPAP